MKKTSVALTKMAVKQLEELSDLGYGSNSEVIRTALDRMHQSEKKERKMSKGFDRRGWLEQRFFDLEVGELDELGEMGLDDMENMIQELEVAQEEGDLNLETEEGMANLQRIVERWTERPEMTAREFHEAHIQPVFGEAVSLGKALILLSQYTQATAGAVDYAQFPDANLPLGDDEDDFVDFADGFIPWAEDRLS